MKKIKAIFILGILISIFPFLGFPGYVKSAVILIFGLTSAAISGIMLIQSKNKDQISSDDRENIFTENKDDFLQEGLNQEEKTETENN